MDCAVAGRGYVRDASLHGIETPSSPSRGKESHVAGLFALLRNEGSSSICLPKKMLHSVQHDNSIFMARVQLWFDLWYRYTKGYYYPLV
jgi:hypothetical protein